MLTDRIGVDLERVDDAAAAGAALVELGVRHARLRFPLAGRARADGDYLADAQTTVSALAGRGLSVLVAVDGEMTVAPGGLGTFADPPSDERLAAAWSDELVGNVSRLAERIGDHVAAWEVLPEPNGGAEPAIAPSRWVALLHAVGGALRAATPNATVVAGGLLSDADRDGVDYLRAAMGSIAGDDSIGLARLPFDTIAVRLNVLADGGPTEDVVSGALSERVHRLWRVLESHEGVDVDALRGVFVSGVGWDARLCGDNVQGRNAWTALDTLTTESLVRAVYWSTLCDSAGKGTGLFSDDSLAAEARRPAWTAVHDFAEYATMISPAAAAVSILGDDFDEGVVTPGPHDEDETADGEAADAELADAELADAALEGDAGARAADLADSATAAAAAALAADRAYDGQAEQADEEATGVEAAADVPPAQRRYSFEIPDAATVLRSQGVEGAELTAVLTAVGKKYGANQWLPPGRYEVSVPVDASALLAAAAHTNQHMISAMYRAGGGTWELLERSGLSLSDLAASRHEPYDGPPVVEMSGLDDDERSRIERELAAITSTENE